MALPEIRVGKKSLNAVRYRARVSDGDLHGSIADHVLSSFKRR